jgi:hypothetical protein
MDGIFKPYGTKPVTEMSWRPFATSGICMVLLLVISFIPGCTTKIISRPADGNLPARGIAYHLPATELSYVMTFRLVDCRGAIEITDTAVEQRIIPDRGAGTYLIDSSGFSNLSKTIPLAKISIANGLLTNISYDAKDNTAGIIKGGATLVGDVIAGATSMNLSSLGGVLTLLAGSRSIGQDPMLRSFHANQSSQRGEASALNMCNRETKDIMDESGILRGHLKTMKRKLYEAEEQLADSPDGKADRIADIENIVRKTKERLAELDRHLTLQYRRQLVVEAGKCESFGNITLESAPFTKWFSDQGDHEFQKQFQAWIDENKLSFTIGNCNASGKGQEKAEAVEGLHYRIPATCKLEITRDTLVSTNRVELMQCGRLAAVEITNGAFQDNSHRLEFDPVSGEIKSFEFKDNAVRASDAISGAGDAVKEIKK